jgi:hypothetical protein
MRRRIWSEMAKRIPDSAPLLFNLAAICERLAISLCDA